MPTAGVFVTTTTRSGPSSPVLAPTGQLFMVGLAERGVTNEAIELRGYADVQSLLGDRVSYTDTHDILKMYFDEGGSKAYFARVVGAAATTGYLTLDDRAVSPADTLKISAVSAGSWSSQLSVAVENGTLTDTFRLKILLNSVVVETYDNIVSPASAVARLASSLYVRGTDLGSVTVAPNNNPAVLTATALSAGTDDRAALTDTSFVNALALFLSDYGTGAVAIPGRTGSTVFTGIDTHCKAMNRIGLCAGEYDATVGELVTAASNMPDSEYVGLFAPWVKVTDNTGVTRLLPPEAYVAGCRARAHSATGPWMVPAGAAGVANNVSDLAVRYTQGEFEALSDSKVNVIRAVGTSIRNYGWYSASSNVDYTYLKDRDTVNCLVLACSSLLEKYVFAVIDSRGHLLASIQGELEALCMEWANNNAFYALVDVNGDRLDEGYLVETGSNINTTESLANNTVKARVSVRISPTAAMVQIDIVKVGTTASITA